MPEPNNTGHGEGDERGAQKSMGYAAVVLEARNRPAKAQKNIQVRSLGGQGHGQRSVGSSAIKSGAAQACAGEKVRDRFHVILNKMGPGFDMGAQFL